MAGIIPLFLYVAVAVNLILTTVILSQGFSSLVNVLFGLIALSTAVWSLSIAGFYSNFLFFQETWIEVSHISALFLALVFFCFAANFPRLRKNSLLCGLAFIPFLFALALITNTDRIIGQVSGLQYEIHQGYLFYAALIIGYFTLGYLFLIRRYFQADNRREQVQIRYVLLGSMIPSIAATGTDLILPYFGNYQYTWLGPVFTLILVGTIFTAIIRHNLFNVKVIATELLTFGLWIFILVRTLLATTREDQIANGVLLALSVLFGFLLIRSVLREVKTRERIQALAEELLVANERLKQLDRQKSEFLSIASHQLRSPLTAMKGYSSMILEGSYGVPSGGMKEAVDKIFQSSNRLARIIDEFLNVTRIELGTIKYDFSPTDFREIVKAVIDELGPNVQSAGITLDYAEEGSGSVMVSADPGKLRQVISNLVDNAIKYTPHGNIAVRLALGLPGKKLRLSVKDSGIGIPQETMMRLFEKFSRADNASHINTSGSGLGLYVAREIIKAHNGKIWAESAGEDKGSSFIFELATI